MQDKSNSSDTCALKDYVSDLLFFIKHDSDTVANRIAEKYGTLYRLSEAEQDELARVCGNSNAAAIIRLAVALTARRVTDGIKPGHKYSDEKIKDYVRWLLFGLAHETVYIISFDSSGRLISADHAGIGTVNASSVLPRRLLDIAVSKKAKSVILAHNHPNGFSKPSQTDLDTTVTLRSVFKNAGIELISHYIVADGEVTDIIC